MAPLPRWPALAALLLLGLSAAPEAAAQADPDGFDPLLDLAPRSAVPRPSEPVDFRSPGFFVGGLGGLYLGDTRSYLTEELSELRSDANGLVGVGLGWRTRSFFEWGLDVALGFGTTWSPARQEDTHALDILAQPRLIAHWYEQPGWGSYAGVAGDLVLYDLEPEGFNQIGFGPTGLLGVLWRTGPHSLFFIEAGYGRQFDFLAYRFRDPSPRELEDDPDARRVKVSGAWFHFGRISIGYRLTALGG